MNQHLQTMHYLPLHATNWSAMQQQVKVAITNYWHQHAGQWHPQTISLHVATTLLEKGFATRGTPATERQKQLQIHLPFLVEWLRQQGHVITVIADPHLPEHRLYLNEACVPSGEPK